MVMSLLIVSVLLLASGAAIVLASRAVPDRASLCSVISRADAAAERVASELAYATGVTEATGTAITLVLPDRTGDGVDDTVRYAWSGNAGDALTRSLNGGAPNPILDDVAELQLLYDRHKEQLPQSFADSAEVLLFSSDGGLTFADTTINSTTALGQVFAPSLPGPAVSWRVTRVQVKARIAGSASDEARAQILTVGGLLSQPEPTVIDQARIDESNLASAYGWQEIQFSGVTGLSPGNSACVAFRSVSGADACTLQSRLLSSFAGAARATSSDGGSSWSTDSLSAVVMCVYGKYTTAAPAQHRYTLAAVRMTLRTGSDAATRVNRTVVPLNFPEVAAP
jgi:hypothetical protein